ncbi:PA2169 family four-helix-bundle protein [Methylocystis sp. 9N]|uniref:PA2169 family four-helix-bundle protein n=1 Tax=Methylocystis borbori TaxID=3118750 RepID=A0ABU7XEP9_9HYPH
MSMQAEATLKNLAQVSRDGEKGFSAASEAVKDENLKQLFQRASARCAEGARELDEEIVKLGAMPDSGGSVSGALHRAWTNLKAAVTGGDDKAILEECERGEDVAKAAYQHALEEDLPPPLATIVRRQYQGVRENHDLIKRLRDAA